METLTFSPTRLGSGSNSWIADGGGVRDATPWTPLILIAAFRCSPGSCQRWTGREVPASVTSVSIDYLVECSALFAGWLP